MFKSLTSRIVGVVVGVIFLTTTTVIYLAQKETEKAIFSSEDASARNLLNTVTLNVENEYRSLEFSQRGHAGASEKNAEKPRAAGPG